MMRASDLIGAVVRTEGGERLGRVHDLRAHPSSDGGWLLMGLVTGLLTLPLAPARGLVWVIEQAVEEADAQLHDPRRIRAELAEAEEALERGELDEESYEAIERQLLERLRG